MAEIQLGVVEGAVCRYHLGARTGVFFGAGEADGGSISLEAHHGA